MFVFEVLVCVFNVKRRPPSERNFKVNTMFSCCTPCLYLFSYFCLPFIAPLEIKHNPPSPCFSSLLFILFFLFQLSQVFISKKPQRIETLIKDGGGRPVRMKDNTPSFKVRKPTWCDLNYLKDKPNVLNYTIFL